MTQEMSSPSPDDEGAEVDRRRRRRGRRGSALLGLVLLVAAAFVVGRLTGTDTVDERPDKPTERNEAYAPRPDLIAEYNGSFEGFSPAAIDNLARNVGLMVVNKNNHGGRADMSAKDVNALAAAARDLQTKTAKTTGAREPRTKVLGYFMTQVWIQRFDEGFMPWAAGFKDEWLMRDSEGEKIPFWGVAREVGQGGEPLGYMTDVTNPDWQAWVVKSLTEWFKSARYSGIALDSTNELTGETVRRVLGMGDKSYNELFCGEDAPVDDDGNCERVAEYNAAQEKYVQAVSEAIHEAGGIVNYNGIAPSPARGPERNLGILERTDVDSALNEAFCFTPSVRNTETVEAEFMPIRDEAELMREQAAAGKTIIQVTNYQNDKKDKRYGGYCAGAFMIGWQPGHSWFVYHANYLQDLGERFPFQSELTLKLGDPVEQANLSARVLTREFDHGWVAVNDRDTAATVTAPFDMVEYRDGEKGETFAAGETLEVGDKDGRFFLKKDFVDGGFDTKVPTSQESALSSPRDKSTTRPRRGRETATV